MNSLKVDDALHKYQYMKKVSYCCWCSRGTGGVSSATLEAAAGVAEGPAIAPVQRLNQTGV